MYLSKIYSISEHNLEKNGSAASKHGANLKGSAVSAKIWRKTKNWRGFISRVPSFWDVWLGNTCFIYIIIVFDVRKKRTKLPELKEEGGG